MISDQLKEAVRNCGCTRYQVSKDSGVPFASLDRFLKGERSLQLDSAEKLAKLFGMRLTKPKRLDPRPKGGQ
jgi:transcriptional regulator with XRE-family HTH domain